LSFVIREGSAAAGTHRNQLLASKAGDRRHTGTSSDSRLSMGWFGKKEQGSEPEPEAKRESIDLSEEKPSCCQDKQEDGTQNVQNQQVMPETVEQASSPSVPAVFEFGGPAVSGLQMKGICEVDDPDQIQACVWSVVPVTENANATPKFQIAF